MLALGWGCGGGSASGLYSTTGSGTCASGLYWTGGNRESSQMNPGMACRACHSRGEGPRDFFMGTAYSAAGQVDGCKSEVPVGATVEILDGSGAVQKTLSIDEVGNFMSSGSSAGFTLPYTARVKNGALVNTMSSPQTDGDCNGCHTVTGANGAPGRILIPQ